MHVPSLRIFFSFRCIQKRKHLFMDVQRVTSWLNFNTFCLECGLFLFLVKFVTSSPVPLNLVQVSEPDVMKSNLMKCNPPYLSCRSVLSLLLLAVIGNYGDAFEGISGGNWPQKKSKGVAKRQSGHQKISFVFCMQGTGQPT